MPDRIAMEVTVRWVTRDSAEVVKRVFEALDASGFVGPAEWVSESIHAGAKPFDRAQLSISDGDFEVLVEGPARWSDVFGPSNREIGDK